MGRLAGLILLPPYPLCNMWRPILLSLGYHLRFLPPFPSDNILFSSLNIPYYLAFHIPKQMVCYSWFPRSHIPLYIVPVTWHELSIDINALASQCCYNTLMLTITILAVGSILVLIGVILICSTLLYNPCEPVLPQDEDGFIVLNKVLPADLLHD